MAAKLAALSQSALGELEQAAKHGGQSSKELKDTEAEVDALAASVWAISAAELKDIQTSLNDLR